MALMVSALLNTPPTAEEQARMRQLGTVEIQRLLLNRGSGDRDRLLLAQAELRLHFQRKLPEFTAKPGLLFPSRLALEQASGESTARFKASLFRGRRFLDTGCGLGIDAWQIGQHFESGLLLEQNMELAAITAYNLRHLGMTQLQVKEGSKIEDLLPHLQQNFDLVYADPARRDGKGGKVFRLRDCEPDITALLPELLKVSPLVAIKTSPLLDIRLACQDLPGTHDVYVLGSGGECREMLFLVGSKANTEPVIHAVDTDSGRMLSATALQEQEAPVSYGEPQDFLFEPAPEVLKAGLFRTTASRFGLHKLHPNSHLYTGQSDVPDFPGRRFELIQVLKVSRQAIAGFCPEGKANLSARNFPQTVEELRRKLQLKEGGEQQIFATTLWNDQHALLLCQKCRQPQSTSFV